MSTLRILAYILVLCGSSALGHDSLYNYLEINIDAKGGTTIHFSIHAAELSEDPEVDPTSQDTAWFSHLSAAQKQQIIDRANQQLHNSYRIEWGDSSITPSPISSDSELDSETRPGCFSSSIKVTANQKSVSIFYTGIEKRLLLVVTKKGAFPKTYDLATGETQAISLTP